MPNICLKTGGHTGCMGKRRACSLGQRYAQDNPSQDGLS